MIDAVEPLSLVLWGVFFLAAGMYPLGFMLGGSCSKCCEADCEEVLEFNRCIRFVNTDISPPPTTYAFGQAVSRPLHGYSRAVSRPEQVGAVLVPSKREVPFTLLLVVGSDGTYANSMSDGETRTATYRFKHQLHDFTEEDAVVWTVTLRGVTLPMTPPSSIGDSIMTRGESRTREYSTGWKTISQNTPAFVSVHSCRVVSGSQWLDGSVATEEALKGLLSVSFPSRPEATDRIVAATFTASPDVFKYVPNSENVVLSYVIEHSRGATRRYTTWQVTVFGLHPETRDQAEGLPPLVIPQREFADTPFNATPPVFAGETATTKTATVYSDNLFGVTFNSIRFPTVEFLSQGRQLRATSFYPRPTNGQYMAQQFGDVRVLERSWIMKPTDPAVKTFSMFDDTPQNPWIYDSSVVESFLAGETTVPHYSGGDFTMQVSEPAAFCGRSLCRLSEFLGNNILFFKDVTQSDALERVVVCKLGKQPPTWTSTDEKGTTTSTNHCYGQDDVPEFSMSLQTGAEGSYTGSYLNFGRGLGCSYVGQTRTCQSFLSAGNVSPLAWNGVSFNGAAALSPSRGLSADTFYCGDLLWVLENGPCRTSLSTPFSAGWEADVFTLGGDNIEPIKSPASCATGLAADETCYVGEVELTVSGLAVIPNNLGEAVNEFGTLCKACGGEQLSDGAEFPGGVSVLEGTFVVPGGGTSCNSVRYEDYLQIDGDNVTVLVGGSRVKWCESMSLDVVQVTLTRQGNYFSATWSPGILAGAHYSVKDNPLWTEASPAWVPRRLCDFSTTCTTQVGEGSLAGGWTGYSWRGRYNGSYSVTGLAATGAPATNAPSITPRETTVPVSGGTVELTHCCPQYVQTIVIPANTVATTTSGATTTPERYARTFSVTGAFGATAYVTQEGSDGTVCPFRLAWLSGEVIVLNNPGRKFSTNRCPLIGQINQLEQPGCPWTVEASEDWIIAEQAEDGLLKVSINDSVVEVYSPPDNRFSAPYRYATITITSGESTGTWEILQFQQ